MSRYQKHMTRRRFLSTAGVAIAGGHVLDAVSHARAAANESTGETLLFQRYRGVTLNFNTDPPQFSESDFTFNGSFGKRIACVGLRSS